MNDIFLIHLFTCQRPESLGGRIFTQKHQLSVYTPIATVKKRYRVLGQLEVSFLFIVILYMLSKCMNQQIPNFLNLLVWCWTVHYEGTLAETGEVFDTTHEDNSVFTFELGKGTVIQAWDVALKTMKVKKNMLSSCSSVSDFCSRYISFIPFLTGWWSCKNNLQAWVCLWYCRLSTWYPT